MSGTQSQQSMEQHSQILSTACAMAKSNMTFKNKTQVSICIGSVHACMCAQACAFTGMQAHVDSLFQLPAPKDRDLIFPIHYI